MHPHLDLSSFFNDCIQQIFPQIQKNSTSIQLFDYNIPPRYAGILITNLLLLGNLKKETFSDFSFYIFSQKNINNEKIELFVQKIMKFNMFQYLPPQIFSTFKLVDSFPIDDLYKNVKHLPDNFFRQKFDAFKKICLKQELFELDNFIEFIKRSQEFNMPLNNSIVHHIHFLISKNFLTRENFQSIDEFTLLDSANINFYECYYDYRATHFIPPETTVENNPQLNSEKANKRSEVMK